MKCTICNGSRAHFGSAAVMGRHDASFNRCQTCGFISVDGAFWLDAAYSSAITKSDIGLVDRNLWFAGVARSVIRLFFGADGKFIDYGGGTGLFTRLMRDAGYDFYWHDHHCRNMFAGPFVADVTGDVCYELLTAAEIFEHLKDPLDSISEMFALSPNILFTTHLLPDPPPPVGNWWYYGLEHGQHISFYSRKTLCLMAERLGLRLTTNGRNLHLFSRKILPDALFRVMTSPPFVALVPILCGRRSLLPEDYEATKSGFEGYDANRP